MSLRCVCEHVCVWTSAKDLQIARRAPEFIYRQCHRGTGSTAAASHLHPMRQNAKVSSYCRCNICLKGSALFLWDSRQQREQYVATRPLFCHARKCLCHIVWELIVLSCAQSWKSPGGALTPAASDNRFNEPVRGCLQYSLQYTVWQTLLLRSAHATGLCSQGNFHYRGKVVHVAQTLVMYGSQTLPPKKRNLTW